MRRLLIGDMNPRRGAACRIGFGDNGMAFWLELVLWLSVIAIVQTYFIYPFLIIALSKWSQTPISESLTPVCSQPAIDDLPQVTVLIAAYNAGKRVEDRIQNILGCQYPADKLRIVIASDGSTDDTVANALKYSNQRVTVLDFRERSGKAATLIRAIRDIKTDVVLFTDVSTHYFESTISSLLRHFEDPQVGIVTGKVHMRDDFGDNCEGVYWKYEFAVRRAESKLGILTGVSGAIYAIRRELFVPPNRPTINDDMVFPILAKTMHGCKFILEEGAVAEVVVSKDIRQEFTRRRRIGLGAFQSLPALLPSMTPRLGISAFALFSHKVLRWLGPFALVSIFLCNILLLHNTFYQLLFCLQISLIALACLGWLLPANTRWIRLCRIITSFYLMNFALGAGFLDWIRASHKVTWEPTPRPDIPGSTLIKPDFYR